MDPFSSQAVRAAYDVATDEYVEAFGDDLDRLPVDTDVLDRAVAEAPAGGWVLEAGCGPAPAAHYLADRTPRVVGVDLSAQMLRAARRRTASLHPTLADLRTLPFRDATCRLAIAYYCLQHLPRVDLPGALDELRRVLRPDGVLAIATHLGVGDVFVDEFLGHPISAMGGALYQRDELLDIVARAGFRVDYEQQRDPEPHEYDTRRIYLIAHVAAA